MKRIVWIGMGIAALGVAVWGARAAWRAHRNIVSIDVKGASVPEVVRSLQCQSYERILADPAIRGQITLNLKNVPLEEALKAVARQAGALNGKVHAVYDMQGHLQALEPVLARNEDLAKANWTTLAPDLASFPDFPVGADRAAPEPPGQGKKIRRIVQDARVAGRPDGNQGPQPEIQKFPSSPAAERPLMVMRFDTSDGTGKVESRIWTPERILMPLSLAGRVTGQRPSSPDRARANELARKVNGKCTTLYLLAAGPGGGGMDFTTRAPRKMIIHDGAGQQPGQTEEQVMGGLEAEIRREKVAQYQDLTPEQRVERMRAQQDMRTNVQVQDQDVQRRNP